MKCERCGQETSAEDARAHNGRTVCEDCYMDLLNPAKACDPWATYTSTRLKEQADEVELTDRQQRIIDLLTEVGSAPHLEVCERLGISLAELERDVATLRHMELVRGTIKANQERHLTLFSNQDS